MENSIDNISRTILSKSKLELPDTSFDIRIMKQIAIEKRIKLKQKTFLLFFFVGAILGSSAYLVIRIFHISFKQPVTSSGGVSDSILNSLRILINVLIGNVYLIFPLLLFLIVRRFVEVRAKNL